MKKVEQEHKQEMKLSRLQAVQRVKQYKQVSTVEGKCISEGRGQRQLELRAIRVRVCPLLVSVFAYAGSAVKEGHTKGLCPTVEESA